MKSIMCLDTTLLVTTTLVTSVIGGFPFMNTDKECRTMLPHTIKTTPKRAKIDGEPFEIHTSDTMYGIFSHVQVHATSKGTLPILGMMIQSRLSDCANNPANNAMGHFEFIPGENFFEYVNCFGKRKSAVTNKVWSKDHRSVKVNFAIAPKENRRIHFVATVVTRNDEIWTGFRSESIRHYNSSGVKYQPKCPQSQSLTDNDDDKDDNNDKNGAAQSSTYTSTLMIILGFVSLMQNLF